MIEFAERKTKRHREKKKGVLYIIINEYDFKCRILFSFIYEYHLVWTKLQREKQLHIKEITHFLIFPIMVIKGLD